ncbi:hypothetical protein MKA46_19720, partial [[Clostridium] innocuum]|nr:hypothetical protein [[Clostridium] innocuum]
IFIDEYPWNNQNLMNHYQMRTEKGEVENKKALIKRSYIHLPVINELVRKQGILKLNDFEQLCFLLTLSSCAFYLKITKMMLY